MATGTVRRPPCNREMHRSIRRQPFSFFVFSVTSSVFLTGIAQNTGSFFFIFFMHTMKTEYVVREKNREKGKEPRSAGLSASIPFFVVTWVVARKFLFPHIQSVVS